MSSPLRRKRLLAAEHELRRVLTFYLNWYQQLPEDPDEEPYATEIDDTIAALKAANRHMWETLPACTNIPF